MKPQLISILSHLSLHDRQTMLDLLLEYPAMADTAVQFYAKKMGGASQVELNNFIQQSLKTVGADYGTKAS